MTKKCSLELVVRKDERGNAYLTPTLVVQESKALWSGTTVPDADIRKAVAEGCAEAERLGLSISGVRQVRADREDEE